MQNWFETEFQKEEIDVMAYDVYLKWYSIFYVYPKNPSMYRSMLVSIVWLLDCVPIFVYFNVFILVCKLGSFVSELSWTESPLALTI